MRGRLVLLEGLGFRANANQSEQIALYLQGMAHGDWLIIYYLAQSMDKANFYNFLVQVLTLGKIYTLTPFGYSVFHTHTQIPINLKNHQTSPS